MQPQNDGQTPAAVNPARIMSMASAFYDSCVLFTASDLGIFAHLAENGPCDAAAVATACDLDQRGARLLLDAATALDLLQKENDRYRNAPDTAMFLAPGGRGDLTNAIRYNRDVYTAWGRLGDLVRSGKPAERPEIHLGEDAARTRTFVHSMHARAMAIGRAVVPQLNLEGRRHLFDVGGGPGTYAMLIAEANPGIECTVLDLPEVVAVADELIRERGMQDRVRTVGGDYHVASFPESCDAVNLFGMLHQEPPEVIRDLLRRSYECLEPGGVVHVLDIMTEACHTRPRFSALFAVNMALTTQHGWVFSGEELTQWLREAGFREIECSPLPPPMPHWLARAVKQ